MSKDNKKKEKKNHDGKVFLILSLFSFATTVIFPIFSIQIMKKGYFNPIYDFLIIDIMIFVGAYLLWLYAEEKHTNRDISLFEFYMSKELESEKRTPEEKDVITMMVNNNNEIAEYFKISKKQEKTSYAISIICSVTGFVMLIAAIIGVFLNENVEITIITIIAGAITEVISGIILWIHNKSAMQLNHYYNALHENEKFLSAIKMADMLDEKERKQMYIEIIKAQIRPNEQNKENENKKQ